MLRPEIQLEILHIDLTIVLYQGYDAIELSNMPVKKSEQATCAVVL